MKKHLLAFALIAFAMTSYSQSIAGISIGQNIKEVERKFGKPDLIKKNGAIYDYGHFQIYLTTNVKNQITKISASGKDDKRGIFKTRLGIVLGDDDNKVVKAYGTGKIIGDCSVSFIRRYVNIEFAFSGKPGRAIVKSITVFPPSVKKKGS